MGFRWVTELFDGRDGGLRDGLQRNYTRRFQVMTDDKRVGPLEVIFAPGIPRLYSSYLSFDTNEIDFFAICRSVVPVQDADDWQLWSVTCEYDTQSSSEFGNVAGQPGTIGQPGAGGGSGAAGDPTQEPPAYEWTSETKEVALVVDIEGDPILNSVGLPFDPPPTTPIAWPVLRYSRNELTYDRDEKAQYFYKTNTTEFLGAGPGKVLCKPITGSSRYIGPYRFFRVNYEFHFAKEIHEPDDLPQMMGVLDWKLWLLNAGLSKLGDDGEPEIIMDKFGSPISTPQPLDVNGLPLSKANIETLGAIFFDFTIYKSIDLNTLNIVL